MKVLPTKRFVAALYERRILSAVADRRYNSPHTFDGTEPVPPIILVPGYRRMFVL